MGLGSDSADDKQQLAIRATLQDHTRIQSMPLQHRDKGLGIVPLNGHQVESPAGPKHLLDGARRD